MPQDASFDELMSRLQTGDPDAAEVVFHRFVQRLLGLARARLDLKTRQKVDPEDVVQSVMKSFLRRHGEEQFELRGWDSLWGLLAQITARKCGRQMQYFRRARRDIRREAEPPGASQAGWDALLPDPTRDEAVALTELLEEFMRGLDDRERNLLELRLQGYTVREIAAQVGRTEHTVDGVLKRIRRRLQRLRDTEPE